MQLRFDKNIHICEEQKKILRKILGIPLFLPPLLSTKKLKTLISDFSPPKIITIGDIVTSNLLKNSIYPDIAIVDLKSKRKNIQFFPSIYRKIYKDIFYIDNPASTIGKDIWKLIDVKNNKILIIVNGEEDLLAIPLSIISPNKSFVIYGQPEEAMVIIIVCKYIKKAFNFFLQTKLFK